MPHPHDFDTIIVGGGPGGSTTGAMLARAGQRVLILEKTTFPRFHIGESLLPFGNDALKESGVWPKVQAAGFMPKFGAEFAVGNCSKFQRFWFVNGLVSGYGQTFQVERSKYDQLLLDHAAECGCAVRQNSAAKSVALDNDGATLSYSDAHGTHEVRSRWLVDASGRDAFVGRALNVPKQEMDLPKRIAVFAHFEGAFRNEGDAAGHITIVRIDDGWFWLIPLDARKTSVGLVRMLDGFKRTGLSPEECFERAVAESSELSMRMKNAQRVGEFYTTSDYTYSYATLAQARMLMVGDAGAFIDPIFSSGVFIATKTGLQSARLILNADAEGRALTAREQRDYTRSVHRVRNIYLRMIRVFYDNASYAVFMQPQTRFRLVQTVNSILAGNTERRFSMWWRVELFHLFCKLQRHFPVVPPLDYSERMAEHSVRS
jgi:flavin-dependent dehydrogenase